MSDSEESNAYLGTRTGQMRHNAGVRHNSSLPVRSYDTSPDRMQLGMYDDDQQPTVWDAVNYPDEDEFRFESYYLRYQRQSEAKAIIDKPVNDTWQSIPIINDEAHKDEDESVSDFEQDMEEFFNGKHTRRKPLHRLNVLDRLARLGEYAVLVLGTGDGAALSEPLDDGSLDGMGDLHYLATFGQDRVVEMHIDSDMNSERFRLPEEFEIVVEEADGEENSEVRGEDYESENIHWSRLIHAPEGSLENDLRGTPALKPVFHELLNIDKIKAASGEGYWRGGYQGMIISPPTDADGRNMKFEDGGDGVEKKIRNFLNNFERTITTPANVQSLDSNIGNPQPHLAANYQSVAAALDIPKSILTGEERADTANSNDLRQWHQKIGQRRNNYAGPVILEPLIQRMIDAGLVSEPDGEGFEIEWQPLDELSEQAMADLISTKASAIQTLSGGNPSRIATLPELRKVINWSPEMGGEVDEEFQPDEAETRVPENDSDGEESEEEADGDDENGASQRANAISVIPAESD